MADIATLTAFLGWCTVINYGLLLLSTALVSSGLGSWARGIHGRLFGLSDTDLNAAYFDYLGRYKLAILVFNLVPYLALKIMGY